MIKVGVTGGIGSGKSIVCDFFKYIGISVYNSDTEAKRLMSNSSDIYHKLIDCFGTETYTQSGDLNRAFLASEVFSNPSRLQQLNSIVHPAILDDFNQWADRQSSEYAIIESAILLDIGWQKYLDKVITVVCDIEKRIERVTNRDGMPRELIERRISSQMTDKQRISMSDFVIECNDINFIIPQILEINKTII